MAKITNSTHSRKVWFIQNQKDSPTKLYEDNVACITQIRG
jgi:hypothetical protein